MILTKTPLRISFAGGGSDYIVKNTTLSGQVVSATINKFVYVIVKKKHDSLIRVSYSKTENVTKVDDLEHIIIRNCLKFCNISKGIEIVVVADIPSSGSGLGSSSALTVGLLLALYKFKEKKISKNDLAKNAYYIEAIMGNKKIGLQDHFSASFGGFRNYIFNTENNIIIKKVFIDNKNLAKFLKYLSLYYTGINRKADKILGSIKKTYDFKKRKKLINDTEKLKKLLNTKKFKDIGEILNDAWNFKKKFGSKKIRKELNYYYSLAIKEGIYGGKILGAGGGGYFIFLSNSKVKRKIKRKLFKLKKIDFKFYHKGSEIVYND